MNLDSLLSPSAPSEIVTENSHSKLGSASLFQDAYSFYSGNPYGPLAGALPSSGNRELNLTSWQREVELMSSLRQNIWKGVKGYYEETPVHPVQHAIRRTATTGSLSMIPGVLIGMAAVSAPPWNTIAKIALAGGAALALGDLGRRVGEPMLDVWNNPESLERNKTVLARNLGNAVWDYTGVAIGFGLGYGTGVSGLDGPPGALIPQPLRTILVPPF